MDLSTLKPANGAVKKEKKRPGRGQGSGKGGTATRGHKGAKSRSGYSKKKGFEGGQMPLQRTSPKFGFKNINRVEYNVVNLADLQILAEKAGITVISPEILVEQGLTTRNKKVKVLGNGTLSAKVEVKAHAFSETAKKAITDAQGTVTIL
ncbi:MAG: 50S ribosomal protein L15 [Bacteroidetes bacterium HGW-Bacteroidetes-21]|nr:MAG: 50S ribosomal protein L15 [Bacteroidetes bacterium HGW-Bacteroidetes-21]